MDHLRKGTGMTAKEKRQMRNLEIKVEQLEQALDHSRKAWAEQFQAIYDNRTAMHQAYACIMDAMQLLHEQIRDDLAFMQIKADF